MKKPIPTRVSLYKKIEEHRGRPLIVYVTSKRRGAHSNMATDALPFIIEQLDKIPEGSKKIDLLISSYGGDPMVAWRIISLLRQRGFEHVTVLVPQSAYSAATLLALGANEIVMHPNGHLGPVDMQITTYDQGGRAKSFSTEDISAFLDFVRDNLKITDQEHVRKLFEATCQEVGSLGIGFTARSSKLAIDLGERLLAMHMKDDDTRSKLRTNVESMSKKFKAHAYPINRDEAIELNLPVCKNFDKILEDMMWKVWLDIEKELKDREPFSVITELLNSKEAKKLLKPVHQLELPKNVTSSSVQLEYDKLAKASSVKIDPVNFEIKDALVESSRLRSISVLRGKILACRNPDLNIQYNAIVQYRGWESTS